MRREATHKPIAVVVVVSAMYESDQTLPLPSTYGKNLIFKTGGVSCPEEA